MNRSLLVTLGLLLLPVLAVAQGEERQGLRQYLFYGNAIHGFPGAKGNHELGGGFELITSKGPGVSLEFGSRGIGSSEKCSLCAYAVSANGSYHFFLPVRRLENLEPFVTAGYSLAMRGEPLGNFSHSFQFGGGVNYWFNDLALRLEVRDHLSVANGPTHSPEFRIGLTF
jgi:hypothetical protein